MSHPILCVPKLPWYERARIQKTLKHTRDPQYRDRLHAVLWSEQRMSIDRISRLMNKHPDTMRRWIKDYIRFGFRGMEVGKSPGRPRAVDADAQACLQQALACNPRDLGYLFTRWTLATLSEHLFREIHIRVKPKTLSRTLRRLRYRYKRPKLSLKHRQNPHEVRRARRQRNAALKKSSATPRRLSSSFKMNVSSISIPA